MNNFVKLPWHMLRAAAAVALIIMTSGTECLAADAAQPTGSALGTLMPLILIMVIFYFLLIRPQQKRLKEHKSLVDGLKKGDKVVTSGGIYGVIHDVADDILKIDIADGVRVKVKRDTISGLAATPEKKTEKKS